MARFRTKIGPIVDCWLYERTQGWFKYYEAISLADPSDAAIVTHCLNKVRDGSDADAIVFWPVSLAPTFLP